MVEKLSAEDNSRLERTLASWKVWQPRPNEMPLVISQLGGDSNLSFVVSDGSARWVLRLNNPKSDIGIDRDNERLAIEEASTVGITPKPVFHNNEILVAPFVSGRQATLDNLESIGSLFSRIHSMPIQLAPIDLLQHLKNYYQLASPDSRLDTCYEQLVDLYPTASVKLKPCHNDCLLPNIIESEQGLCVLDWEYAAATDPAYDIAVFSSTYGLDVARLDELLSGYDLGDCLDGEGLKSRIEYFEKFYRLIEILWWGIRGRDMGVELGILFGELGIRH